jgi:G3E family GTPase
MKTPAHLVTGFLGVGKTTAILDLLARRPANEKWAVLVNEFGQVGIDGATLSASGEAAGGVAVREVPGGCICCTAQLPLKVALTRLLREVRPDRLIVEPTGVGHPAGVIDALRDVALAPYLQLVNVITLVDPRQFCDARYAGMETYRDQLALADVLVANKCDLASPQELVRLQDAAAAMYPPKLLVVQTERGRLNPGWLELRATHDDVPAAGHGDVGQFFSKGWTFAPELLFDAACLQALFEAWAREPAMLRAKGVLRVGRDWRRFDLAQGSVESAPLVYRRDSRVEIIAAAQPDWARVESQLCAAIRSSATDR